MTEIQFDLTNLNIFLIIGLILLIGGYLYYEIYKIKKILNDIEYHLDHLSHKENNYIQYNENNSKHQEEIIKPQ